MKVGDLVALRMKNTQPPQIPRHGIVLSTWRNHKGKIIEVEIMWSEVAGVSARLRPSLFEVISEGY